MTLLRDFSSNTGAPITTVPRPAGTVDGDVLITHILATSGAPAMAGWTTIASHDVSSSFFLSAFWKLATAGDPANFSLSGAGTNIIAVCTAWYNADTASPIDGTPATATGSPVASVTTTVDNSVLLTASVSNTPPTITGMTLITDVDYAAAVFMQLKRELIPTAGATGNRTTTGIYNTMQFAVKDSGVAPVPISRSFSALLLPV